MKRLCVAVWFSAIFSTLVFVSQAMADWGKIGPDMRITNASGDSWYSSLVWTGTEFGVSWQDRRDGNDEIYFARIDSSGNKIGSDVRITNDVGGSGHPSLVWTGTEYGVSWYDNRDGNTEIYFARIDSTGAKIGTDMRITNDAGLSENPSLAWANTEYGVSWIDNRDGNTEIYFARIDSSGSKIGGDARITNDSGLSTYPSLVWTGIEYGVSWYDDRDGNWEIYFVRVDTFGSKIGGDARITNDISNSSRPSLVWTGVEYGVSWNDFRDSNNEIYFARIDTSGNKLGTDVRITIDVASSMSPSLVWMGTEYGVSWQDDRDGANEIYFARIGQSGQGPIPTLSEWGMLIMAGLLLLTLAGHMRRQYSAT